MKKITILGCGWLGLSLTNALKNTYRVIGTWRSETTRKNLESIGIETLHVNLSSSSLPDALFDTDVLCLFISPSTNKETDYKALFDELIKDPRFQGIAHVLFTSSTSVYQKSPNDKEEDHPIKEENPMIQVENALHVNPNICILRLAGLMGKGRYLSKYYPSQRILANALSPVNHLHHDDALGVIETIIAQHLTGVYNVCAPLHPTKEAIIRTQCESLHVSPPLFEQVSDDNGIVKSTKLIDRTGYQFIYPDPCTFPIN